MENDSKPAAPAEEVVTPQPPQTTPPMPKEIGGVPGPDPTRYGDWQHKGRVSDF